MQDVPLCAHFFKKKYPFKGYLALSGMKKISELIFFDINKFLYVF